MKKWKVTWQVTDTIEADTEEEARAAFVEMAEIGDYAPHALDLDVQEVPE